MLSEIISVGGVLLTCKLLSSRNLSVRISSGVVLLIIFGDIAVISSRLVLLSTGDIAGFVNFNVFRCGLGSSLDVHKFRSSSSVDRGDKLLLLLFFLKFTKVLTFATAVGVDGIFRHSSASISTGSCDVGGGAIGAEMAVVTWLSSTASSIRSCGAVGMITDVVMEGVTFRARSPSLICLRMKSGRIFLSNLTSCFSAMYAAESASNSSNVLSMSSVSFSLFFRWWRTNSITSCFVLFFNLSNAAFKLAVGLGCLIVSKISHI